MRIVSVLAVLFYLFLHACGGSEDTIQFDPDDPPDPITWPNTHWGSWLDEPEKNEFSCDGEPVLPEPPRSMLGKLYSYSLEGRNFLHFGSAFLQHQDAFRFQAVRCPVAEDGNFVCPVQFSIDPLYINVRESDEGNDFHRRWTWELSGQFDASREELSIELLATGRCYGDRCDWDLCHRVEAGVATPWSP